MVFALNLLLVLALGSQQVAAMKKSNHRCNRLGGAAANEEIKENPTHLLEMEVGRVEEVPRIQWRKLVQAHAAMTQDTPIELGGGLYYVIYINGEVYFRPFEGRKYNPLKNPTKPTLKAKSPSQVANLVWRLRGPGDSIGAYFDPQQSVWKFVFELDRQGQKHWGAMFEAFPGVSGLGFRLESKNGRDYIHIPDDVGMQKLLLAKRSIDPNLSFFPPKLEMTRDDVSLKLDAFMRGYYLLPSENFERRARYLISLWALPNRVVLAHLNLVRIFDMVLSDSKLPQKLKTSVRIEASNLYYHYEQMGRPVYQDAQLPERAFYRTGLSPFSFLRPLYNDIHEWAKGQEVQMRQRLDQIEREYRQLYGDMAFFGRVTGREYGQRNKEYQANLRLLLGLPENHPFKQ